MNYQVIVSINEKETQNEPFITLAEADKHYSQKLAFLLQKNISFKIYLNQCNPYDVVQHFECDVNSSEYLRNKFLSLHPDRSFTQVNEMIFKLDLIRIRKEVKHTDISLKSGLKTSNISRFFSYKKNPTLSVYIRISNAVNLL